LLIERKAANEVFVFSRIGFSRIGIDESIAIIGLVPLLHRRCESIEPS